MRKKTATRYTQSQLNAQLVRSWRDNFVREGNGLPLLLIVGGKVLMAEDIFSNIAMAIELQESVGSATPPTQEQAVTPHRSAAPE